MPIYEYYCPDNHTVYQFYAKTLAQGKTIPQCPDNPKYRMVKCVSSFAVTRGGKGDETPPAEAGGDDAADDGRMEAAMSAMEKEFAHVDENDPRAMGRMMRRMAEMTGEKLDGEMEEVVRKLEEGADPESLEDALGDDAPGADDALGDPASAQGGSSGKELREKRARFTALRQRPARRDPQLYDYV